VNVDCFLLCEFASVTDNGQSLSLIRSFNSIGAKQFPVSVPVMAIAMVIHAHQSEAGTTHELETVVLNHKREKIANLGKNKFTLAGGGGAKLPAGLPLRHNIAHRILNATFPSAGVYAFEAYIDGTYVAGQAFLIEQVA
jgi:hypothetical protein